MSATGEGTGLHSLLAHHVLNTLEWPSLRPLQKRALGPIANGDHALLVAPTAGGKTEAAVFPVLSRMLYEDWAPLSVLYLCPLRALLNNLFPRIEQYGSLVGRRVGLWHGDVGSSERDLIRMEPPDVLLTTPESIEAMLISRKTDHHRMFRNVRALVVDEIHAFAGDDRGWHLLAVAERVQRIAGRNLQRIGLSATVGNPDDLLQWLTRTTPGRSSVIAPLGEEAPSQPDVELDYVGSLENAATVLSRLHRGEKRLVFVDSRARVEELAVALRDRDVRTFVSHGSLGREERLAAEQAFASARDCVIVSTSTLELGIDVGDLDRVVQIDAPSTVASFLQRLGRTGRRAGTRSNALFLATSDEALLTSAGLLKAWEDGFVEPLEPAPLPLHLVVQQLLALVLQEGGVGRRTWQDWYGDPFVLGEEVQGYAAELTDSLVADDFLFEDNGILGIGTQGQRSFGGRNFLDLMAVFSQPPNLRVLAGRREIGQVEVRLLTFRNADGSVRPLLLAGRNWDVLDFDWKRGVVQVELSEERGKAKWQGEGRGLSFEICQAMKEVVTGTDLEGTRLSRRAAGRLEELRGQFSALSPGVGTVLEKQANGSLTWWTFAGGLANIWLASGIGELADQLVPDDLSIRLASGTTIEALVAAIASIQPEALGLGDHISEGAVDRLKFADALPGLHARTVVERRLRDDQAVRAICGAGVQYVASGR